MTLAPTSCDRPAPLPAKIPVFAVMFAAVILPLTLSPVSVPILVIFGCAAVVNVPVTKLAVTKFPPETLPALRLPDTINEVSVPTLVIFG